MKRFWEGAGYIHKRPLVGCNMLLKNGISRYQSHSKQTKHGFMAHGECQYPACLMWWISTPMLLYIIYCILQEDVPNSCISLFIS